MALFEYQATDAAGRIKKGVIEARDERAAAAMLQDMARLPISIREHREKGSAGAAPFLSGFGRKKVSSGEVLGFTEGICGLLEAGVPLDRSLSILAELEGHERMKDVLVELNRGIRGGGSLAACLEKYPEVFPEIYMSAIRAAEASGSLDAAFMRMRKYLEESKRLKETIRSALIYPALLFFVGGCAVLLMLLFVIPRFAAIFAESGAVMPLPTRALLGFSALISGWWWAILASVGMAAFFTRKKAATDEGRLALDGLKLRAPLIGPVIRKAAISRFSRTFGTLLQGGLPIIDALNISIKAMGNRAMAMDMAAVAEGVRGGKGIGAPLREVGSFTPLAKHLLAIGEETGKLDEMLIRLADNYDEEIGIAVKRLLSLLEPLIILVLAVIIGFFVIALLLAVFSLNEVPM